MTRKSETPTENYLKIPNHILNIPGLGKGQKMLLAHIHSYGRRGCWESNETLGRMFFRSPRTVSAWIADLKKGSHILWVSAKGYHRTLYSKTHPEVKATQTLLYRKQEVSKTAIISGQIESTPPRRNLPSKFAENCEVTAQKSVDPLRRNLPPTIKTTRKETNKRTTATPTPLPAGGQSPALLEDRKADAVAEVERFLNSFGAGARRTPERTAAEREQRRQKIVKQLEVMREQEKAKKS